MQKGAINELNNKNFKVNLIFISNSFVFNCAIQILVK